jgi:hypothetical protein
MNSLIVRKNARYLLALAATLTLLISGCVEEDVDRSDEGSAESSMESTHPIPDTRHTRNVRVFDNVKRLDDRAAHAVYVDGDVLRFPISVRDSLAIYEAGDIMATSEGEGLLRKVESIRFVGQQIIVETEIASLAEVFASGEIYVAAHADRQTQPPESFRYAPMEPGYYNGNVARQQLEADWDGELFSWDKDFSGDINNMIGSQHFSVTEASVGAGVGAEFYVDAGAQVFPPSVDLKTLRAGVNGNANATLRVKLESSDTFSYNDTIYLASTDSSHQPLVQLQAQSFDVAGLVDIEFTANSKLDLSVSANGTISAEGEVAVDGNIRGGLERKNGTWTTYSGAGLEPSGFGPAFDGQKSFTAQAKLTNTIDVNVSNAATGYLTVKPATLTVDFSQQINASSGACPTNFNVNVKGEVEGQIEKVTALGFDFDIMDSPSSWTIYDKNFLTHQGQLEFAGTCDPDYEPPQFGEGDAFEGQMCREDTDCATGIACFRETCVREGPLRFSVAWFEDTDVDLEIITPSGEKINWRDFAQGGGEDFTYDFPQCTGKCFGPGPYVESIFADSAPETGTYTINVIHEEARNPSNFALTIVDDGDVRHEGGKLGAEGEAVSFQYTVQ